MVKSAARAVPLQTPSALPAAAANVPVETRVVARGAWSALHVPTVAKRHRGTHSFVDLRWRVSEGANKQAAAPIHAPQHSPDRGLCLLQYDSTR